MRLSRAVFAAACVVPWTGVAARAAITPVNLASWMVVQYEFNEQPDASWSLSSGNTVATQSVNADASILVSDFSVSGLQINGTWRVNTTDDDDFMGFVFGYQDRGHYYLFDWKQLDQNDPLGFSQRGMSVKVVNRAGDPTGADLWPTAGSVNVDTLVHNTISWNEFTDYDFTLNFPGTGVFQITVKQGSTVLEDWIIADSTYGSGNFGFYNYSQGAVVYQGFTANDEPPVLQNPQVPEASTVVPALATLGLLGSGVLLRRRTRRNESA